MADFYFEDDTIAAVSSARGEGGIGIVRISGKDALNIMKGVFLPAAKREEGLEKYDKTYIEDRRFIYGFIVDSESGETVDEAMAVYMKGPHSYTCEDVVELQVHGSIVSLERTLRLALRKGARLAEPGEFTKRAFLHGRLDLMQAEAVADAVGARAEESFKLALSQLSGRSSESVKKIMAALLDIQVEMAVNIDYPDEDIEETVYEELYEKLLSICGEIDGILASSDSAKAVREGLSVSIAGLPNSGKSSLLNELLGENRAIVTAIPGTTRDTIEEYAVMRGLPLRLIDTAGIRETDDEIERLGIERSRAALESADLLILMIDITTLSSGNGLRETEELLKESAERKRIVVLNKTDLLEDLSAFSESAEINERFDFPVFMSLKDGSGVEELKDRIENMFFGGKLRQSERSLSNIRHIELMKKAKEFLEDASRSVLGNDALDIVEIDVKSAYDTIGKITGETADAKLLDELFSRFCLGK